MKIRLATKRSKYGNRKVEYQGWKFDSQLECDYYRHLQLLAKAGEIAFIMRQIPFHLAPGSKLVVDFMVRDAVTGQIRFIDTKGMITREAKTKIKLAEHLYDVQIEIVKRGDF